MSSRGSVERSQDSHVKNQPCLRVLVADDHPVIQEGIVTLLNAQPNLCVVATVSSFPDLWKTLKATSADIVILDIGNMGGPPIMAVEQLRDSTAITYPGVLREWSIGDVDKPFGQFRQPCEVGFHHLHRLFG